MALQTKFVVGNKNSGHLNKALRFFLSDELMKDWILHNTEESGETENIVPALYANQGKLLRKPEILARKVA